MAELNIESFGAIIDNLLEENYIQMIIDLPEGTREATVEDNTHMGPVVQFYILLHGMSECLNKLMSEMNIDPNETENLIDGILEILKNEIINKE